MDTYLLIILSCLLNCFTLFFLFTPSKSHYTIEEDTMNLREIKAIRHSSVKDTGNLTRILDVLIKEAANCESYASDLFISWEYIMMDIRKASELSYKQGFTYYFGFRNLGVDHESFIQARLDATEIYGKVYRSLYRLHITVKGSEVQGTLVSLSLK